jgi:hypothetical protein
MRVWFRMELRAACGERAQLDQQLDQMLLLVRRQQHEGCAMSAMDALQHPAQLALAGAPQQPQEQPLTLGTGQRLARRGDRSHGAMLR